MRSFILYILVLVFVFSCKQNGNLTPEKPEGLLSEKEMVDVLYDLAILNAAKSTNRKILENNNINPVSYIHEKHNIDSLQFANSNAYYAYDLDLYESLYSQVKIRLEKDSDRIKKLVELDQKRIDSLREERKKVWCL